MKFKGGVGDPGKIVGYSDEYYTSADQVKDVVERVTIDKSWKILCPFDKEESEFVKYFITNGYNVTYLKEGEVNTDYKPEDYDIIVTNPPWRNFNKLYSDYFDRCERFITILSWTILYNCEKRKDTGPLSHSYKGIKLKSFMTGKYRSTGFSISFNATNSDKNIGCFYLYKGFTSGTNIQPVVPLVV